MNPKEKATCLFLTTSLSLLIAAFALPDRQPQGFLLHAVSQDSFGVQVGSPVKVHGIEVGHVTEVSLVHDPALPLTPVHFTLQISLHGASFLKEETIAHIERVQMGPGIPPFAMPEMALHTHGQKPLASGTTIETIADETLVESLSTMSHEMTAVRGHFASLGALLQDLRGLTKALLDPDSATGKVLTDPEIATSITDIVRDARATAQKMRQLVDDAQTMSSEMRPVIQGVDDLSKEGRRTLRTINTAMSDVPKVVDTAERTLALAEALAKDLRTASRYAPELARKMDASLEEANRLVDAAQRSVLLRGTLPERKHLRTEAEVRPVLVVPQIKPDVGVKPVSIPPDREHRKQGKDPVDPLHDRDLLGKAIP